MKTLKRQFSPKTLSFFFLITFSLLQGCAGKTPRSGQPGGSSTPTVNEAHPDNGGQPTTLEPGKKAAEPLHITLVLGGAGVASFATVGLLKKLQEEGIRVDTIVTTGWPTLFALGYGFFRSIHDVEWFAMRLQEKDFYKAGIFEVTHDYESQEKLSALIQGAFQQKDLGETKIPVIVSATNTDQGDADIYDRGDWKEPLLKTMSIPGIYRPYPQGENKEWVNSLRGIDVEEAAHRGAKIIVAVEMYDDYFNFLRNSHKGTSDNVFRKLYLAQLTKTLGASLKLAQLTAKIDLSRPPNDFSAKRLAIQAGYREGARLAKELRAQYPQ